jgi:alkanesulfonate monooxygenase SsuD/methylene tetrahydromethanopterin reductase-like flavin-dependent oxidoreductase (luciferase family)
VQQPHPPIWVGGQSRPALRRAARFADVWHPHDLSAAEVARVGEHLDELAGRPIARAARLHVTEDDIASIAELVDSYYDVGCVSVILEFRSQPCALVTRLAQQAAEALDLPRRSADCVMSAG